MYILDTNCAIYYLKNEAPVADILEPIINNRQAGVSTITEIELFSFPYMDERQAEAASKFLETVYITVLDSKIARLAGKLRSLYKIPLADSAIAATALYLRSTLLTRNIKDFKRIPDLKLQKI